MKLQEQLGSQDSGKTPLDQQVADPVEQWRCILHLSESMFELLQFLHSLTTPQRINQGFLGRLDRHRCHDHSILLLLLDC